MGFNKDGASENVVANLDVEAAKKLIFDLLRVVGENPEREGLKNTPDRVARMYAELLSGYAEEPTRIVNNALFHVNYDEMVLVRDIEFYSLCEHHMLPFFGKCHIAYLPGKKVIGLSKLPRLVDVYARRLQVQERMTQQIADTLNQVLKPKGVGVIVEARHFCMMMRGVEKQHSAAVTSAMFGCFRDEQETRQEFLSLIRAKNGNGSF